MNLLQLKYAVEVAKTRSISKAAENLYMGQPNLSRAIKELEESLGITIFKRTSKGILLTSRGEEFLERAKNILQQISEVEQLYNKTDSDRVAIAISVPRSGYLADSFIEYSKKLDRSKKIELYYRETNSMRAITNILQADYDLGIISYKSEVDQYFNALFIEKGLKAQTIFKYSQMVVLSSKNSLAAEIKIKPEQLAEYIEVAQGDPFVPSMSITDVKKTEHLDEPGSRIFVFDRASQLETVASVDDTYMISPPVPGKYLERYGLVQVKYDTRQNMYRDVLIYKKDHVLSTDEAALVDEIRNFIGESRLK